MAVPEAFLLTFEPTASVKRPVKKNTIGGYLRCASVNNFVLTVPIKQLPVIIVFTPTVKVNNPSVLKHFHWRFV